MTLALTVPGAKTVTVNGLDLSTRTDAYGTIWVLNAVSGWYGTPKLRTVYTARPQAAGSYYTRAFSDVRTITVDGTVYCADARTLALLQRQLSLLSSAGLMELRVTDAAGALYTNVQRSSDVLVKPVGNNPLAVTYSVSFTAPDPRLLDPQVQHPSTLMAQSSGFGVPWRGADGTTGIQWRGSDGAGGVLWRGVNGGNPTSGVLALDNTDGTADADIIFTITGPALNPSVSTSTSTIAYGGDLSASDVLVIDTGSGSVLLNGVNRRPYLTSAQWFTVPPQSTLDVRFSAEIQNAVAECTAAYQVSYA